MAVMAVTAFVFITMRYCVCAIAPEKNNRAASSRLVRMMDNGRFILCGLRFNDDCSVKILIITEGCVLY